MPEELARKLTVVLAAVRDGLPAEEICRRYGIGRRTYYRWRRELIRTGLVLLAGRVASPSEGDPGAGDLERRKAELERRVTELERLKAIWELRYKLLRWRVEDVDGERAGKIIAEINRLLPERLEGEA